MKDIFRIIFKSYVYVHSNYYHLNVFSCIFSGPKTSKLRYSGDLILPGYDCTNSEGVLLMVKIRFYLQELEECVLFVYDMTIINSMSIENKQCPT